MKPARPLRLVFVDDEPQMLTVLRAVLRPMQEEWDMSFVESGERALALMAEQPCDVVVSDMRMPGMNGAQLLNEVMKRHPQTIRMILSGFADEELVLKCVGTTHQYLTKPFDLGRLQAALQRIASLNARLASPDLQRLVAQIPCLPSMPSVYVQIIEALQVPDCPLDRISAIVRTDPALAAKILQLVNSAFFGFAREVASITEAVQLLGVGIIRSLALTVKLFSSFDAAAFRDFPLGQVWQHSLRTGMLARQLAGLENADDPLLEQAFTAGLLHDIGKLILAANLPAEYLDLVKRARAADCPLAQAEQEMFNATHADVGAHLLGIWGLPVPLVEAVALHHAPSNSGDSRFSALTAVHVANLLSQQRNDGVSSLLAARVDAAYLKRLGLRDRLEVWHVKTRSAPPECL